MRCPSCNTENPARARFCLECGAPLAGRAPAAGPAPPGSPVQAPAAATAVMPPRAPPGVPTAAPTPAAAGAGARGGPEAERRQLTVLFCDLADFTPLSERLDPEDLRAVLAAYQEVCASVIRRFEGHIARYFGDGVMVYFGYPVAHEDAAQRAVRSGLGIVEAVGRLNDRLAAEHGVRLTVRLGIHTGQVVAGDIAPGAQGAQLEAMAAVGEAPNVAARLQGLAAPNAVVLSGATHRLVAGYFECRDLGLHTLKGISQPMPVYQALHESAARSRLDVVAGAQLTPLAGRDAEVARLREHWARARDGQGQVVLLCGEPGIGKSRLVRVLAEHVTADPQAWLTPCQCLPYYQNSAFYPVIDLLERVVLRFGRDEPPASKLDKLEGWLAQYGFALPEAVPLFAALLSVPLGERFAPLALAPERQRQRTMEALVRILVERAAQQPLLLAVEDLHWADQSTLELLDLVVERAPGGRMLALFTFRPEYAPPWSGRPHVAEVTLERLSRRPVADMVEAVAGGKRLPAEVLEQVVAKTDGVPLFVEELTKYVLESGLLRPVDGRFELAGPLPPLAIPATLQDSLMARLDRLATVKVTAQLGATIGREFAYELLEAVAPLDPVTLQRDLAHLVEAGLLYTRGVPPQATYSFKHALIQDTAYASLLRSTRRQYHQRIAQALAERFPATAETQPELLAHHYTQAGLNELAVPYWLRAGQRALQRAANLEAIAHLTRGMEVLKGLPENRERDQHELEMQMGLMPAYMAIKGWASGEVEHTCRRARDLAAALGDGQRLYAALWGLWTSYFLRGQLDETLETAQQVLGIALSADVPMLHVTARHAMGYSHFYRGEFPQAREHAEEGVKRFDSENERAIVFTFQFSSTAAMRMFLGCSLWMLGYPDQAPPWVEGAVSLTRELNHTPSHAYALAASLLFYHYCRDLARTREAAKRLFRIAAEEGFEIWSPFAMIFHGPILVQEGKVEEGIAQTKQGIARWQATGSYLNQTIAMEILAESLWNIGRTDEALAVLADEIAAAAKRREFHFAPELYRLKGEILLQRAAAGNGAHTEAEAAFRQALEMARAQSARMLELRAAMGLARVWQRQGRPDEARRLLAEIYGAFTEGFATPDLQDARALLVQLGSGEQIEGSAGLRAAGPAG